MTRLLAFLSIMIAGVAQAAEPFPTARLRAQTDAAATFGIGSQTALGVQLHATGLLRIWSTARAEGTFDFGLLLNWQNEPQAVAPWIDQATYHGQNNRLHTFVTVGHGFHLGRARRTTLGVHFLAGWTHFWSTASYDAPAAGIANRSASMDAGRANVGLMLKLDHRFHEHVGFNLSATAPLLFDDSYVRELFHVGAGLSFYF